MSYIILLTLLRLKLRRRARGCWADGDDTLLYGPIRESSVADEPDGRRPARCNRGKRETTRQRPITTEQPNYTPRIFPAPGKIYLFSSFFFLPISLWFTLAPTRAPAHTRATHISILCSISQKKIQSMYIWNFLLVLSWVSMHVRRWHPKYASRSLKLKTCRKVTTTLPYGDRRFLI